MARIWIRGKSGKQIVIFRWMEKFFFNFDKKYFMVVNRMEAFI